jgi:hypothetical protein
VENEIPDSVALYKKDVYNTVSRKQARLAINSVIVIK